MSVPSLELKNVTRILEDEVIPVTLVKDISCTFKRQEFVSIVGSSGSGKSSLLYLMGLLDQPTLGKVFVDGIETTGLPEEELQKIRLEKIGFVFQFHFLMTEFSALDNVMLPMRKLGKLSKGEMKDRAEELLGYFGLKEAGYKKPGQLSGGERQRVAVARAMANKPLLLLADEPTGNLDTKNGAIVLDIFRKLVEEEGVSVITITHDLSLAEKTDRQVHLQDGRIMIPE